MHLITFISVMQAVSAAAPYASTSTRAACHRIAHQVITDDRRSQALLERHSECRLLVGLPGLGEPPRPQRSREYGNIKVNSPYGMRLHPIRKKRLFHNGVDLDLDFGEPVHPLAPGTVRKTGVLGGYGKVVVVQHRSGKSTVYAHLSEIHVAESEVVTTATVLGLAGATGLTTGPHLHLEVREAGLNSSALDPAPFIDMPSRLESQHVATY